MRNRLVVVMPLFVAAALSVTVFLGRQAEAPALPQNDQAAAPTAPAALREGEPPPAEHGGVTDAVDARLHALQVRAQGQAAAPDSVLALARLLHDAHRPGPAAQYYRQYLANQPEDRRAWLDLANVLASAGLWQEALEASQALLELDREDAAAMYNTGAILATLGREDEARTWWNRVTEGPDPRLSRMAKESMARLTPAVETQ